MRIGTTSYIVPADIITNVRRLAGRVDDVELLIFEANSESDLPDKDTLRELREIAAAHAMTYTVHLPLDLGLPGNSAGNAKALQVIGGTAFLEPVAFILHLDGKDPETQWELDRWAKAACADVEALAREIGDSTRLCVENLEGRPPEHIDLILDRVPVSCCIDVGHLWKDGLDPLPFLDKWLPRAGVVHLHGMAGRDHKSLSVMPNAALDPVIRKLRESFSGVVTLEVFNEQDLEESLREMRNRSVQSARSTRG